MGQEAHEIDLSRRRGRAAGPEELAGRGLIDQPVGGGLAGEIAALDHPELLGAGARGAAGGRGGSVAQGGARQPGHRVAAHRGGQGLELDAIFGEAAPHEPTEIAQPMPGRGQREDPLQVHAALPDLQEEADEGRGLALG
jgi:hypothetical protein